MYLCAVTFPCAVFVCCYHLSGAWLLHRSQLFSVFLPPAYGLLCSQQSFIGFLLMVRAPSAPLGALFVLPLLPLRLPSACSRGSKACSLLPVSNYACSAFALPASTCLSLYNLLVSCGFCLAGHFLLVIFPSSSDWLPKSYYAPRFSVICSHCYDQSESSFGLALVPRSVLW